MPSIREIPRRANFLVVAGNHAATTRLSYAVPNGAIARLKLYTMWMSVVAGAAQNTAYIQSIITGVTYPGTMIDYFANTAGPAMDRRTVACDLILRNGDIFSLQTFNASGVNIVFQGSYHIEEYV